MILVNVVSDVRKKARPLSRRLYIIFDSLEFLGMLGKNLLVTDEVL